MKRKRSMKQWTAWLKAIKVARKHDSGLCWALTVLLEDGSITKEMHDRMYKRILKRAAQAQAADAILQPYLLSDDPPVSVEQWLQHNWIWEGHQARAAWAQAQ